MIKSSRHPVLASDFKFEGSSERAVGYNGDMNASSKKDLMFNANRFMQASSTGQVITASDAENKAKSQAVNKQLLASAFEDPKAHRILGERIADNIYMTANRKGFARRFLNRIELKQGDIPRFPVRKKNVTAMLVSGPTRVEPQIALDRWLTPPELQIVSRIFVPQNEINQSNTDVLEEKFVEGLEGIMVTEDRMWVNAAKQTIGIDNNQSIIAGTLSPLTLMSVRQGVAQFGLKPMYCLMANDLFTDIVGDASFIQAIEPVARHELIMTGELAVLYGMTLISEAYRHPEHKVLSAGEFVVVSDPAFHGAYSDRGGVDSQPTDGVSEKMIGRGWLLSESISMALANSRSVSWGLRL